MNNLTANPKRVLVLMSDTGGGHRAAAEAIKTAADLRYPNALHFDVVDVFRYYTPAPFKYAPEIYPAWVNNAASLWQFTYLMTDNPSRGQLSANFLYYSWRQGIRRMFREHPADMILSVHPIITRPIMMVLQQERIRPPFMTVVTDLVSTHSFWYEKQTDRCLVPTQAAYERGIQNGLKPQQLRVTGLPTHPRFLNGLMDKRQARQELGLDPNLPAVLLVSGGDGMGPVYEIARALNRRRMNCQLVIICGRNEKLRHQLEQSDWHQPTHVWGFVNFMPKVMAACDMLVTKAGPATITEAMIAGLPIIISGAIPGQEDGNVTYVVDNGVGVYAPKPRLVANAVESWLSGGMEALQQRAEHAKTLARPDAVWDIVDEVYQLAQRREKPITLREFAYATAY